MRLGALECELDLAEVAQLELRSKLQRTHSTENELREMNANEEALTRHHNEIIEEENMLAVVKEMFDVGGFPGAPSAGTLLSNLFTIYNCTCLRCDIHVRISSLC